MFAYVVIRVLTVIGFTLFPMVLFSLWFQEELKPWEKKNLGWFRVAGNIVIGSIMMAIMLAFMS